MNKDEITTNQRGNTPDTALERGRKDQQRNSVDIGVESQESGILDQKVEKGRTSNNPIGEQGQTKDTALGYKYIDEDGEHLHTYNGQPLIGTSTVMKVISKPLTYWASGLAVTELGWTKAGDYKILQTEEQKRSDIQRRIAHTTPHFEKIKSLSVEDYIKLLDNAYKAHASNLKKSADKGTDLHELLEGYVKAEMADIFGTDMYKPPIQIQEYIDWSIKNVNKYLWSEMHCFSEKEWLGGITDAGAVLNDGRIAIIDFKSSKEAYLSQFGQCAGYDIQISENGGYTRNGKKIFDLEDKKIDCYIVVPFGANELVPKFYDNPELMKSYFKSALTIHKIGT